MKLAHISALLAGLIAAPTSNLFAATMTYGSIGIVRGSDVDRRFALAREACMIEAATPPRGILRTDNFYYGAALRACLYRQGFSDDGSHVYPVPLFGSSSIRY